MTHIKALTRHISFFYTTTAEDFSILNYTTIPPGYFIGGMEYNLAAPPLVEGVTGGGTARTVESGADAKSVR